MMFGADGTVSVSSGWTFHEGTPKGVVRLQKGDGLKGDAFALKEYVDDPAGSGAGASRAARASPAVLAAIQEASDRHHRNRALRAVDLDKREWSWLFQAMIEAESAYNPTARSPKNAFGLGQLMPETARELGVDRTDMRQNLDGAARYLLAQLAAFQSIELALAAYNAGPHRITQYGGVPPFKETRTYIARINRIYARLSGKSGLPRVARAANAR